MNSLDLEVWIVWNFFVVHLGFLKLAGPIPVKGLPVSELIQNPDTGLAGTITAISVTTKW
jgi:hypothetical protein